MCATVILTEPLFPVRCVTQKIANTRRRPDGTRVKIFHTRSHTEDQGAAMPILIAGDRHVRGLNALLFTGDDCRYPYVRAPTTAVPTGFHHVPHSTRRVNARAARAVSDTDDNADISSRRVAARRKYPLYFRTRPRHTRRLGGNRRARRNKTRDISS